MLKQALIKSGFKSFRPAIHGLKALEIFKPELNQPFPGEPRDSRDTMFQKIKLTTQCITLIGMPGSGKSTLGVQLAKRLRLNFFDTDKLIETRVNMSLQTWLNKHDYLQLRKLEENILLETRFAQGVIATGGSVVYSEKSMQKLVALGPCIYLQISQQTMLQRIGNGADRGLAISANTTFADMYEERTPLYLKWATNVVNCDQHSPDILVEQLIHICPSLQY